MWQDTNDGFARVGGMLADMRAGFDGLLAGQERIVAFIRELAARRRGSDLV